MAELELVGPTQLEIGVRRQVFNATMRDARKAKGLTLSQLAQLVAPEGELNGDLTRKQSPSRMAQRLGTYERMVCMPPPEMAQEIADALEVPLNDIFPEVLRALPRPRPQEERVSADAFFAAVEDGLRGTIDEMLQRRLKARERQVIEGRFGFDGKAQTAEALGRSMGVTRMRVYQIETNALLKLRAHPIADFGLEAEGDG